MLSKHTGGHQKTFLVVISGENISHLFIQTFLFAFYYIFLFIEVYVCQ